MSVAWTYDIIKAAQGMAWQLSILIFPRIYYNKVCLGISGGFVVVWFLEHRLIYYVFSMAAVTLNDKSEEPGR